MTSGFPETTTSIATIVRKLQWGQGIAPFRSRSFMVTLGSRGAYLRKASPREAGAATG